MEMFPHWRTGSLPSCFHDDDQTNAAITTMQTPTTINPHLVHHFGHLYSHITGQKNLLKRACSKVPRHKAPRDAKQFRMV